MPLSSSSDLSENVEGRQAAERLCETWPDTNWVPKHPSLQWAQGAITKFADIILRQPSIFRASQRGAEVGASMLSPRPFQGLSEALQNADDLGATELRIALRHTPRRELLPAARRRSMTPDQVRGRLYDRGSEMACHPELARRLRIDIWFCDPHAPWPRGSNENTNGLLRQFFPKGTDLSDISQTERDDLARLMNQRPRKTLGWKTPEEAMAEELAAFRSTVALAT